MDTSGVKTQLISFNVLTHEFLQINETLCNCNQLIDAYSMCYVSTSLIEYIRF